MNIKANAECRMSKDCFRKIDTRIMKIEVYSSNTFRYISDRVLLVKVVNN